MKSHRADGERSLAVFIDFENMGLGFNGRRDRFEIGKVLERLVEKGKIVCKKAYADWSRFGAYTGALHEAAIELIEIPRRGVSGKNSADIRLVVDAIDLAYSKDHIDTFCIVSGDSDFSPLVSKLKELGKHVIGLGLVDATSDLLRDNCDEFIYYEDLDRAPIIPTGVNESIPEKKRKGFALLLDSLLALRRENKDVIYSSMVKETMKRKKPSFNEGYYGYRAFSELLEDAEKSGLVELDKHKTSGMYIVTRFGLEMQGGPVPGGRPAAPANGGPRPAAEPRRQAGPVGPARDAGREPAPPARPAQSPAPPARPAQPPASPAARQPAPRPVRPPAAAPPAKPVDDRPLGRALVDEFDPLDDVDEIPSYAPRKAPATAPPPAPAAPAKPAGRPPARAGGRTAAKPAAPKADAPPSEPAAKPAARRGGSRRKPAEPAAEAPPPKPKPPVDDDDFSAGLND
ncbi:NYN domain-containing protein [Urbifossiella limnaea]|uniref:NYN domain protein n=1 Tax=Urbifossiella limnaea TaxID=2528023 RepID=A0A517XQW3_9BACT|nr:NYN domain-containing protein [Urbifossiella limnaea]QDU19905.1 NYN domain protein [Urbifossiella limnaea]